jgi:hypothetical protein
MIAVLSATLASCAASNTTTDPTDPFEPDDRPATSAAFDSARQRWNAVGITSYQYQYRRICFCAPPATARVRVTVRGDRVVEVVLVESGQSVDPDGYPTIDEIFGQIGEALSNDADIVEVSYDSALAYPVDVYLDPSTGLADEEQRLEIRAFQRQ